MTIAFRAGSVLALMFHTVVSADVDVLVAVEPSLKKEALSVHGRALEEKLHQALGYRVSVSHSEDLGDSMRATRTAEYDVFVGPPQVAASAMAHGYDLLGANSPEESFVLVARKDTASVINLRGKSAYLPPQDSIYTYVTRGMLNAHGVSFAELRQVEYRRYPQAGLIAVGLGFSDVTAARLTEWEAWANENPDKAASLKVMAASSPVPGGYSVVVRQTLPAETRAALARWFQEQSESVGLKRVAFQPEAALYKMVGELGHFTPTSLPGAEVVDAQQVRELLAKGAVIVDTRSEKEFTTKRIPQAILASYVEKSLKDVAFDPNVDNFKALHRLDKALPTIFACNGPECWKSYKASKAAIALGFKKVYWFRGGLPAWEAAGYAIAPAPGKMAEADEVPPQQSETHAIQ